MMHRLVFLGDEEIGKLSKSGNIKEVVGGYVKQKYKNRPNVW